MSKIILEGRAEVSNTFETRCRRGHGKEPEEGQLTEALKREERKEGIASQAKGPNNRNPGCGRQLPTAVELRARAGPQPLTAEPPADGPTTAEPIHLKTPGRRLQQPISPTDTTPTRNRSAINTEPTRTHRG
jgi:hypothetical protein